MDSHRFRVALANSVLSIVRSSGPAEDGNQRSPGQGHVNRLARPGGESTP